MIRLALACGAVLAALSGVAGETVRLKSVADIGVSSMSFKESDEREKSWGLHTQFKLKTIQEMAVIRFDAAPAKGREVKAANLFLHRASPDRLRYIRVSTVNGDWQEGTTRKPYGPPSGACYNYADWDTRQAWAWPGSQLCDVIMSSGNSLHHWAECHKLEDGWLSVPLSSELIYALCVGDTDGLAVQEGGDLAFANNFIHSVQSGQLAPYIEVDLGAPLTATPAKPQVTIQPATDAAQVDSGRLRVHVERAENVFCWRLGLNGKPVPRWQVRHPVADGPTELLLEDLAPGAECTLKVTAVSPGGAESEPTVVQGAASAALPVAPRLGAMAEPQGGGGMLSAGNGVQVWACPGLVKIDPESGDPMFDDMNGGKGRANAVWDGRQVSLFGCRGEYVSFQLVVERPADKPASIVLAARPLQGPGGARIDLPEIELYRTWLARNKSKKWQPAYCVPLAADGAFQIPDPKRAFESQRVQTVYVDIYVPKNASPGIYKGAFNIAAREGNAAAVPIELQVFGFDMPDRLAFWPQLNCYRSGVPQGLSEIDVYRLCHQHRNVFFRRDYTPKTAGGGKDIRVEWDEYDRTVGPLLSGEAFKSNRRAGVPIEALALPFYDSWPTELTPESYAYKGDWTRHSEHDRKKLQDLFSIINQHYQTAPYIGDGLSQTYKDAFVRVQQQFIEHFREKDWDKTELQCLFMGKNTHRIQYGVNMWWTTDEPYHWDDWLALQFFARLWTENRGAANADRWVYRADISRPMWQGRLLDGIVDNIHFGTGAFSSPADMRRCRELARQAGFDMRVYGSANQDDRSNTESVAWILNAWAHGAQAALPWQSMGNDHALDVNDSAVGGNALVAPGERFGVPAVADIRLKAFRDAEQVVEYLVLFAKRHNLRREQVAAILAEVVELTGSTAQGAAADNADALRFSTLKAWQIAGLRRALAAQIAE